MEGRLRWKAPGLSMVVPDCSSPPSSLILIPHVWERDVRVKQLLLLTHVNHYIGHQDAHVGRRKIPPFAFLPKPPSYDSQPLSPVNTDIGSVM